MYKLKLSKEDFKKLLKENHIKQKEIAKIIGVDETYISQAVNGRIISKLCAYSICKAINSNFEIVDLFIRIEK